MGKNKGYYVYILCLLISFSSCVYKDDLADTAPGDEVNKQLPETVVPVSQAIEIFDTIATQTTVIKKDTTKVITVIATPPIDLSAVVQKVYTSQIGVREATGKNDGVAVEMYLRSTGLGKGNAWCAAFVHWCLEKGGVKNKITAWSPTAYNSNNPVFYKNKRYTQPKAGDVGVLYYPALKRIGHAFFWDKVVNESVYESVEGNTDAAGSREGQGVYRKKRSYNSTYGISRWIN